MSAMAMVLNSKETIQPRRLRKKTLGVCIATALLTNLNSYAQNLPIQTDSSDPTVNTLNKPGVSSLPGVRTSVTYSDNLLSASRGAEQGGFRLEVTPYILAVANSAVMQGYVFYAMRNFYRTAGPQGAEFDGPRHDLRSNGRLQVIDGLLYLKGSAFTYNVNPINFAQSSFDPAATTSSNNRVQGFTISPFFENRLGNFATYSGGYSYGQSTLVQSGLTSVNSVFTGSIASGASFNRWGWSWGGENQNRSFGGRNYERNTSTGILYWVPNENFRVGASLRYSQIDGFVNTKGKDRGYGPGIALDWVPSSRTRLKLTANAEYFGNTGDFYFNHDFGRFSINAAYEKSVLSSNDATLLNQNPTSITSAFSNFGADSAVYRNYVNDSLFARYGVLSGLGVVDGAYVARDGGRISLAYKLSPISTAGISYSDVKSSTQISTTNPSVGGISVTGTVLPLSGVFFGNVHTTGINTSVSLGLDAASKVVFSFDSFDTRFLNIGRRNQIRAISGTYSTKVSPSTTASVGIRRAGQTSTAGAQETQSVDNSVFGALDMRF
jgi:uncharacterized protein (PEP-CTERM system associated)